MWVELRLIRPFLGYWDEMKLIVARKKSNPVKSGFGVSKKKRGDFLILGSAFSHLRSILASWTHSTYRVPLVQYRLSRWKLSSQPKVSTEKPKLKRLTEHQYIWCVVENWRSEWNEDFNPEATFRSLGLIASSLNCQWACSETEKEEISLSMINSESTK